MARRDSFSAVVVVAWTLCLVACTTEVGGRESLECDDQCDQNSGRQRRAEAIRDIAANEGFTNAVLLAGIAEVETNMNHCWSDAPWACKGPSSPSCNGGPTVAGSADGPCSAQKGGLGMFQFDSGTYKETLKEYGNEILTLEGNIDAVTLFVLTRIVETNDLGLNSHEEALRWVNSIPVTDGDPDYEAWLRFVSWRFNGCKDCPSQINKYREGTSTVLNEFGLDFWGAAQGGSAWIGDDCSTDPDVCTFANGECLDWHDEEENELRGFCSSHCEGTCPDQTGRTDTFCAEIESGVGYCASVPSDENDYCRDIPGSVERVVSRNVGSSSVTSTARSACVPPHALVIECDQGRGTCIDTNSMDCAGTLASGQCPGRANIQCCSL